MLKSMIINSMGTGSNVGKKYQKSVTNVNPNVSNEIAGEFAKKMNALTTNTYGNTQVVKKMDVTEEDTVTLKVDDSNKGTLPPMIVVNIENGVRLNFPPVI